MINIRILKGLECFILEKCHNITLIEVFCGKKKNQILEKLMNFQAFSREGIFWLANGSNQNDSKA